jgi:hypothetical protein
MKRTAMKPGKGFQPRAAPIQRGESTLRRGEMKRAASTLKSSTPMRTRKPAKDKPKRVARNAGPVDYLALCRGQPCYLLVPGVAHHPPDTVVPCHSNQQKHGKGMGIKARDIFTVPGCFNCHYNYDQGRDLDKAQRYEIWDRAYRQWAKDRLEKYGV